MNIFDGLYGYECVMLICGFVLFVFALAAIAVMLVQRRSMKALVTLLLISIVMMGFPGIQSIKFSHDLVEIDRARTQQPTEMSAAQKQQYTAALVNVQQRSSGEPLLQAKVADGYRAIGEVDKAYDVASSVLAKHPTPAVRELLVPTLTRKLEQSTPPLRADAAAAPPLSASQHKTIATITKELQMQSATTALPAQSHVALAKAYVVLGDKQQAKANVETATHIDPGIKLQPALKHILLKPATPATSGGH